MSTDQETLLYTQNLRKKLVGRFLEADGTMSQAVDDPKAAKVLLTALADMDKQVLSSARLENEKDAAAADRELAIAQNQMLQNIARSTGNPFERKEGNSKSGATLDGLNAQLPQIEVVEGQMDRGISTTTYQDFRQQFQDVDTDAILAKEED